MKAIFFGVAAVFVIILITILGFTCRWTGEAVDVAQEEFGPRELLRKYEWFKDVSATLDKKIADIAVYEKHIEEMASDYDGVKRMDWDRTDKEQFNQWATELAGIKMSYNSLAAEYNSQMVKFNWRFTNAGDLPEGATELLPREYKPYETR